MMSTIHLGILTTNTLSIHSFWNFLALGLFSTSENSGLSTSSNLSVSELWENSVTNRWETLRYKWHDILYPPHHLTSRSTRIARSTSQALYTSSRFQGYSCTALTLPQSSTTSGSNFLNTSQQQTSFLRHRVCIVNFLLGFPRYACEFDSNVISFGPDLFSLHSLLRPT